MSDVAQARTFISYSRKDGSHFAARLRRELEAEGFSVWQDLVALEGGRDWWSQIEAALQSKALQHFIVIITPAALESPVVRREIRLARQEGKSFLPVKGPELGDLNKLPRWIGQLMDIDLKEHRATLKRILEAPSHARRVPMMAPEPPSDFVPRPSEFATLKAELLDAKSDAVAITAALRGAGGYGKTTLAKALAHDPDLQDAYFDGILWVELGETGGGRVTALINDLTALLTGRSSQVTTIEAARTILADALGDRRILLVIDDVWHRQHLDPFLHGGRSTTRLVTTRFDKELPETAVRQKVDAMQPGEAHALLERGLPSDQTEPHTPALRELSAKLHGWAQLLKLANGFLRDRVVKYRQPLDAAIAEAASRLAAKGLPAFDDPQIQDYDGRHKSVAAAIGINLDLLDDNKRSRFGELAVFPEDADIPIGVVARLWACEGALDEFATLDLLSELYNLSLLLDLDLSRRTLRLHDTTRHFLHDQARRQGKLAALHQRLVQAIDDVRSSAAPPADTAYFYRYLLQHLSDANARDRLDVLLLDPAWLKAKLEATNSPQALVHDYQQFAREPVQSLIGQTLQLTAGICTRDPRQLLPQLLARLDSTDAPEMASFLEDVRRHLAFPALLAQPGSLAPPGSEAIRLEGHDGGITALSPLADGRLASGSWDATIRLWDTHTTSGTMTVVPHESVVTALLSLPEDRLLSGCSDGTIRLWHTQRGTQLLNFEGHEDWIRVLVALPEDRFASGSDDKTVRMWDLRTGASLASMKGHTHPVRALAALPEGQLASASSDMTIRIWDLAREAEIKCIIGHESIVSALAALPKGRLASAASGVIAIWDVASGRLLTTLKGHGDWVTALAPLPDGRLASASADRTIRLWDIDTGAETGRLEGHGGAVSALALLSDDRLASAADDRVIRLWNLKRASAAIRPRGHESAVGALAVAGDELLISASDDRQIRLWDRKTGREAGCLKGHTESVNALAVIPGGRILASASDDDTLRLWDLETLSEISRMTGYGRAVSALLPLSHDRLVSACGDRTIRVWDWTTGSELARLKGHRLGVSALAFLPDGRIATASGDNTVKLWDLERQTLVASFEGSQLGVNALAVLPDGRLVSGSGDTAIRLWDIARGVETGTLNGHQSAVLALAVLPGGRIVSASRDNTIRVWNIELDTGSGREMARIEVDASVLCLTALSDHRIAVGDSLGQLHWLNVVE